MRKTNRWVWMLVVLALGCASGDRPSEELVRELLLDDEAGCLVPYLDVNRDGLYRVRESETRAMEKANTMEKAGLLVVSGREKMEAARRPAFLDSAPPAKRPGWVLLKKTEAGAATAHQRSGTNAFGGALRECFIFGELEFEPLYGEMALDATAALQFEGTDTMVFLLPVEFRVRADGWVNEAGAVFPELLDQQRWTRKDVLVAKTGNQWGRVDG